MARAELAAAAPAAQAGVLSAPAAPAPAPAAVAVATLAAVTPAARAETAAAVVSPAVQVGMVPAGSVGRPAPAEQQPVLEVVEALVWEATAPALQAMLVPREPVWSTATRTMDCGARSWKYASPRITPPCACPGGLAREMSSSLWERASLKL